MDPEERTLARVFRALRWAGVAPCDSWQPPRVSNAFVFYGRLLCFILGGLLLTARVFDELQRKQTAYTLAKILSIYFIGNIAIACMMGILYVGMFRTPEKMRHIFQCLENLRKIRQQVGSLKESDGSQRDVILLFMGSQLLLIFITVYDTVLWQSFYDDKIKFAFAYALVNLEYFVINLVLMPFVMVAMTICTSFRAINEQLEELHLHLQSLVKRRERSPFLTDLKIQVATINNVIDKLGNMADHNDGKFELPHEKLRSLTQAYVRTCEVVHQHNTSESALLAMVFGDIVTNLIITVFFLMEDLEESDSRFVPIAMSTVLWVAADVCRGMLLVSPSHAMSTELQRSRMLLCKLMSMIRCNSDPLLAELEVFLLQLNLNQPVYVALGMFPLSRPLIITMMAVCATYQVVTQGLSA